MSARKPLTVSSPLKLPAPLTKQTFDKRSIYLPVFHRTDEGSVELKFNGKTVFAGKLPQRLNQPSDFFEVLPISINR